MHVAVHGSVLLQSCACRLAACCLQTYTQGRGSRRRASPTVSGPHPPLPHGPADVTSAPPGWCPHQAPRLSPHPQRRARPCIKVTARGQLEGVSHVGGGGGGMVACCRPAHPCSITIDFRNELTGVRESRGACMQCLLTAYSLSCCQTIHSNCRPHSGQLVTISVCTHAGTT